MAELPVMILCEIVGEHDVMPQQIPAPALDELPLMMLYEMIGEEYIWQSIPLAWLPVIELFEIVGEAP